MPHSLVGQMLTF